MLYFVAFVLLGLKIVSPWYNLAMSFIKAKTRTEKVLRELAYAGFAVVVVITILVVVQLIRGLPLASVVNPVGFGCQAVYDGVQPEDYKDSPLSELRMEVTSYKCDSSWSFFVVIGTTLAVWVVLRMLFLATTSPVRRRCRRSSSTPVSSGQTGRGQG